MGALEPLPAVKVQQFATAGLSLDAARMQRLAPVKRYTFIAALIHGQGANKGSATPTRSEASPDADKVMQVEGEDPLRRPRVQLRAAVELPRPDEKLVVRPPAWEAEE